jgi:serine/threonine protein kinase
MASFLKSACSNMDFNENFNSSWSYKYKRLLDSGGRADVYLYSRYMEGLAEQEVVLKILRDPQGNLEELLNEGKKLSELKHPNILSTLGYEKVGPSKYALILEYIKGRNLRELVPRFKAKDRTDVAGYIIKVALEALKLAHSQKIIHGDISSRNILISDKGQIKLSDFGESRHTTSEIQIQVQRGSVDYLAPERWGGSATSMAADVFALGILAFELLRGFNPIRASSLKEGQENLATFLKEKSWLQFTEWSTFFNKTLLSDPEKRGGCSNLIEMVPISNFGREKLMQYSKSPDSSFNLGGVATSTQVFLRPLAVYFRQPLLKFLIVMFCLVNSVAIGMDHALDPWRLKPSTLTLTSFPWGEVFMDGVSLGFTPLLNVYLQKNLDHEGLHILTWRDAGGFTIRRTIMDYGNALFSYQIIKVKGRTTVVTPLMSVDSKEGLEP